MKNRLLKMAAIGLALTFVNFANAALISFEIQYDDTFGGGMESNIIGSGTFSYEGVLSTGEFLLSDLVNISYESTIGGVFTDTSDITTPLDAVSLFVFEELGITYAIFVGNNNGSLDFSTGLSHEPGSAGDPCCGGTDLSRLYFSSEFSGNYQMKLAVPEPSTLAILGLGLMGLAARRFKKKA